MPQRATSHLSSSQIEHSASIRSVVFSEDGELIASADVARVLKVWDDRGLRWTRDLTFANQRYRALDIIRDFKFSPDGRYLFVASGDIVRCLSARDASTIWSYECPPTMGFLITTPQSLAVSPLGIVAAALDNGFIGVWNDKGELLKIWEENDAPRFIAFMSDGETLVGCDGFTVSTWNAREGERMSSLLLDARVYGFAASPQFGVVATRSLHEVTLYNPDIDIRFARVPVAPGLPAVAFSTSSPAVAVGDACGVNVVSFDGDLIDRFDVTDSTVLCVAFSPDDECVLAGCADGRVRSWGVNLPQADSILV